VEYAPWLDEEFVSDVVNILRRREGEWVHPGRIVLEMRGGECDPFLLAQATYKAVCVARRLGDQISGDTVLGYRYEGFTRTRYIRIASALVWPPAVTDERSHKAAPQLPGQMTIKEAL